MKLPISITYVLSSSFVSALLLSSTINLAMDSAPQGSGSAVVTKPMLEADKVAQREEAHATLMLLEASEIPGLTKPEPNLKATFSGKSYLEINQILLAGLCINIAEITADDKATLVSFYQSIYLHLSRMGPEEKANHALRFYKARIYALGLALHNNDKKATKAWLTAADCYTDEEKELEEFIAAGTTSRRRRDHYLAAKQSIQLQKNRGTDAQALTQELEEQLHTAGTLDAQLKQYDEQVKALLKKRNALMEDKKQHGNKVNKTIEALKTNGVAITHANTVYQEQLMTLREELQNYCLKISKLEKVIATPQTIELKTVDTKKSKSVLIQQRTEELAHLKEDQAATQRDIDLLTDNYSLSKKFFWKVSGIVGSYPVEAPTPGNPDDKTSEEEEKEVPK